MRGLALSEGVSADVVAYEERYGLLVACVRRPENSYRPVAWDRATWDVVTDVDLAPLSWGTDIVYDRLLPYPGPRRLPPGVRR
ncbi:hypothetical protein OIB37_32200 [Streptomyces sp. NBC_00820]|uniref:hypothetical protein n=1 Tax=Streptomyces sp. NBC_00820 TaxID=2975842 RepID=UPI002ED61928|nr:hypothetical protein OIB37_32200 [Streptomyces sp. NBC_00820]